MLIFKSNDNIKNFQNNSRNIILNDFKSTPPPKNIAIIALKNGNNKNKINHKKEKSIKINFDKNQKNKLNNKYDNIKKIQKENIYKKKVMDYDLLNNKLKNDCTKNIINFYQFPKFREYSKKSSLISNNFFTKINIKKKLISNNSKKENNLDKVNNNINRSKSMNQKYMKKGKNNIKEIHKMETFQEINKNIKSKIYRENIFQMNNLLKNDSDMQELNYEEAIIFDKRSFSKMYWNYLIDSQIILATFFINNNLDLFIIKLSFLVSNFQTNFFFECAFLYR